MYEGIKEAMFEFAITVQGLVKDGWGMKIRYGDRQYGGDWLVLTRGDEKLEFQAPEELEAEFYQRATAAEELTWSSPASGETPS